jgi:hypothetical protein
LNRSHFPICIHVYIVFAPYSPSYTLSLPPSPHWCHLPDRNCLLSCSSILCYFVCRGGGKVALGFELRASRLLGR